MANSRTIEFKGHFDGKQVLDELKKIRQNMANAGADANLFKGVDKNIVATEKLVNDMIAQIKKGFSNEKEISAFEKQLNKLSLSFNKINVGLRDINQADNFKLNADAIKQYSDQLKKLSQQQEHLQQVARSSIETQLQSAKLNQKERQAILDEIDAQGDLEAAIKRVAQAKEKATKIKHGTKALETDVGKDFIRTMDFSFDANITAASGRTKMGRQDARARTASGKLVMNNGAPVLDNSKVQSAIDVSYRESLEEIIKLGGTAADAVEIMRKKLEAYGAIIQNTDSLQESFNQNLQNFYNNALTNQQQTALNNAQALGSTDAQGNFNLSQQGQNLVNNAELQAAQQNLQDITQAQNDLSDAIQESTRLSDDFTQEVESGLNNAADAEDRLTREADETTQELREQNEATTAMNQTFDNMKNAVKTFLSIGSAIRGMRQVITQTFNDVKELDKSFAQIAMVTNYSVNEMWDSYDKYAEMANRLGQSTKSVIQASGLFYQQGNKSVMII